MRDYWVTAAAGVELPLIGYPIAERFSFALVPAGSLANTRTRRGTV